MQHINRLLTQLRKEERRKKQVYSAICFIDYDREKEMWIACPTFWDGVAGSGSMNGVLPEYWIGEYSTADEAHEAVGRLFDTLDIIKPPVIIIDDLTE